MVALGVQSMFLPTPYGGAIIELVKISLTIFQSNRDDTRMIQVIVLPHWSAPVAGT